MLTWLEALIIAVSATILIIITLYFLIRRRCFSKQQVADHNDIHHPSSAPPVRTPPPPLPPFQAASKRLSYPLFWRGTSTKPVFNWADHPSLIVDVVENGWSRFTFTNNYTHSPSLSQLRSSLRRVTGDQNHHNQVELSWEVGQDSVDFMQKIRFHSATTSSSSAIRMALPLPGPPPSFPQEAYFEIKVIRSGDDNNGSSKGRGEGENMKLIQLKNFSYSSSSTTLTGNSSSRSGTRSRFEEIKLGGGRRGGGGQGEGVKMSVGLAAGGSTVTNKMPGAYPGSVGFNSDGSVYLGGMKLVAESEKEDWARAGKVIGCGFNPNQKKVFFTVDGEVIHVIHCKSEDFGTLLYPVLTANIDVTLLVNLGQCSFSFAPANAQRTPNPCFIGPIVNSSAAALGYDDSRELFSIGRLDNVEWLNHNSTIRSNEESEVDLFDIALDSASATGGKVVNEHSIGK